MNILFEFSNCPFVDDLAAQYARMALSISLENNVSIVYKDDALVLSQQAFDIPIPNINYFDQERFLVEQEVNMYALDNNKSMDGKAIKDCVKLVTDKELSDIYQSQNIIFRN